MRVLFRNYLVFALLVAFSFLFAEGSVFAQSNVVTEASETALRDAMATGGLVVCSFDGTITLSNAIDVTRNVTLDAHGHSVAISGNNSNRIFNVASGVNFSVTNVVFANGRNVGANGADQGLNSGQPGQPGQGGAIFIDGGTVWLNSCILVSNSVSGGQAGTNTYPYPVADVGGEGQGGAIFVRGGSLMLSSVSALNNSANGGLGATEPPLTADYPGKGGNGAGGALYATNSTVLVLNCNLSSNLCTAPAGGYPVGAASLGGALFLRSGFVTISNSILMANTAAGSSVPLVFGSGSGDTPGAAYGGALAVVSGEATLIRCQINSNSAIGGGAHRYSGTGEAQGGAIHSSGTVFASESSFAGNQALSGSGSNINSDGRGGAFYNLGSAVVSACSFISNLARGGSAGGFGTSSVNYPGGNGWGGAICNVAQLNITNCTIALNSAGGGDGGIPNGIPGSGLGGGVYNSNGVFTAVNVTIASNSVVPGRGYNFIGFSGGANAGMTGGTLAFRNSILAYPGGTNGNAWGAIVDAGYNMSSDGSANFNSGTSFNFTDPLLQVLADNGGPTLTMALSPGSPAVDFGTSIGAPLTDQRGFARPSGLGVDMGAYERQPPPVLTLVRQGNSAWLSFRAQSGATYVLQKSTTLATWTDIEVIGPFGTDTQVNRTYNLYSRSIIFFRLQ